MTPLTLAVTNSAPSGALSAQWAHDIRNALATVGLHLETLQRLSGSSGRDVANAAQAMMLRAAAMCNDAIAEGTQTGAAGRRRTFDIVNTIVQVADLLRPAAPDEFEIRIAGPGPFSVLADPQEVFRILFNLVNNAITVARQGGAMSAVTLLVERTGSNVTVRVADDGPGLPKAARAKLFRPLARPSPTGGSGLGLAIARELAERNGGVLELAESARGTTFVLTLLAASQKDEQGVSARQ
jgi:signal transduction histidine kinase